MKTLVSLILIFLSFSAQADDRSLLSEFQCVYEIKTSVPYLTMAYRHFDIANCSPAEIDHDMALFVNQESGDVLERFSRREAGIENAMTLLETDHSNHGGSAPFSAEAVQSVKDLYDHQNMSVELGYVDEFAVSEFTRYIGQTRLTTLVFLVNEDQSRMVMISKLVYAE